MTWMNIFLLLCVSVYFFIVLALFAYGLNFFYLSFYTLNYLRNHTPDVIKKMDHWPAVTVQLPIYNEWYVAPRLIEAVAAFDYPKDLLEIQVLDDSTDETVSLIADTVARLCSQGIKVIHMHRTDRRGYKAGALGDGLASASGEFIAIFDADFLPPPDFLKRTLPYFDHEKVAFVQTRWGHLNRDYSFITLLQSLSLDAHFLVEQFARSKIGFWFNFNGTAGIWRKEAIQDAGGWKAETLTEDLDLSYRAFLRGWQARYVSGVVTPAELPVSFTAFRRQQHRWARGSLECALRFVPIIWRSQASFFQKVQASLHLTGYVVQALLVGMVVLYPSVLLISYYLNPRLGVWFNLALLFNITVLAPTVYFITSQMALKRNVFRLLPAILFMNILGAGMMFNTLRAMLQIIFRRPAAFERTPKYGITGEKQSWDISRYFVQVDWLVFVELAFAFFSLWTVWLASQSQNWLIAFYSFLYAVGLFYTAGSTIFQFMNKRIPSGRQA